MFPLEDGHYTALGESGGRHREVTPELGLGGKRNRAEKGERAPKPREQHSKVCVCCWVLSSGRNRVWQELETSQGGCGCLGKFI